MATPKQETNQTRFESLMGASVDCAWSGTVSRLLGTRQYRSDRTWFQNRNLAYVVCRASVAVGLWPAVERASCPAAGRASVGGLRRRLCCQQVPGGETRAATRS